MTPVMAAVVVSEQRLGRDGKHRLYLRQQGWRYVGAHVDHRLSLVVRVHPAAGIVIVRLAEGTVKLLPQLFVVVCDAGSGVPSAYTPSINGYASRAPSITQNTPR